MSVWECLPVLRLEQAKRQTKPSSISAISALMTPPSRLPISSPWRRAWREGIVRGFEKGADLGAREGSKVGENRGSRAAGIALVEQVPAGGRSESRSDIGYRPPEEIDPTGGVLVVGDSLEVLTSPYLDRYLPRADLTINAEGGYNSLQLLAFSRRVLTPLTR